MRNLVHSAALELYLTFCTVAILGVASYPFPVFPRVMFVDEMPKILIDPESKSLGECYALIKTPRKNRSRYPEACVTPVAGEQAAREGATPDRNLHPALVYGPSKSSEGQRIYYLVRWLN